MRVRRTGLMLLIMLMASMFALSACSNSNENGANSISSDNATGQTGNQTNSQSNTNEQDQSGQSGEAAASDPLGKYDPPIEVSTVRAVNQTFKYDPGKSLDNNIWTDIFKNQYGITVKNDWVVDASQYDQKLNIAIASGQIPDFLLVNREQMMRLYESDQLEDLSDILKTYGSDYMKELLNQDQGTALNAATFDGKLVGIPQLPVNGGVSSGEMIYLRYDWLQKLNLPEPKTIDDVVKIATAFAKDDPDGNDKNDTNGLGVNKDLFSQHGSLKGFFNGFNAYPQIWVKEDSGKLVYGSIQPEMKTALEKLHAMYADGVIDQEFAVKDWNKIKEEVGSGKVGLAYGTVADGGYIEKVNKDNDPNADWRVYPIASLDGSSANPQLNDTANQFYIVRKGAEHPEAVVKLGNIYLQHYYLTNYAPDPNPFINREGIFPAKYVPVIIDPMSVNLDAFRQVQDALAKGDGSQLGFPANVHYDRLTKYAAGDQSMWFSNMVFGELGSFSVIDYYDKNGMGVYNQYQKAATPTMSDKQSSLEKLELETYTKIIMGQSPISEFDNFVKQWKKLGGDKITEEVNADAS
ncbi:extracellular solute-binding protein [Paenibacillus sp. HB172176]|uniref:extracellular solute-binding protein n=1 Tax=Paenibacillus sp. HB172176 TaxID=2493690 RepID=UPI00143C021A|nr:extracellular solute-binding protein [Paenibacillus sp. HB172176]